MTHTYIQKLVRGFATDSSEMERDARRHAAATFEQLRLAQEETRKQKERGCLRPRQRWKMAKFEVGGRVARVLVPTKAEKRRQAEMASGRIPGPGLRPSSQFATVGKGVAVLLLGQSVRSADCRQAHHAEWKHATSIHPPLEAGALSMFLRQASRRRGLSFPQPRHAKGQTIALCHL